MTTQLRILENILWLPLCRINKFGLSTLPSKTVAIPYTCGLSVMHIIRSLASKVTDDLVTIWFITERVKRLAGNEIELGMWIPTIESRASNIPMDKGNNLCCHNGSTDKDLPRIFRSQYEHPSSAIGYWPERCLGHVYIVLEPAGSARLTFDDNLVLYELCDLVTECCSESRMRSRTWRGVSKWSRGKDWYIGW